MAETCILAIKGEDLESAVKTVEKQWWRGSRPRFIRRQKTKPTDKCGNPVTHRQREINNLRNKLTDLRNKTRGSDLSGDTCGFRSDSVLLGAPRGQLSATEHRNLTFQCSMLADF